MPRPYLPKDENYSSVFQKYPEIIKNLSPQSQSEIYDRYFRPIVDLSFNYNSNNIMSELRSLSGLFRSKRDGLNDDLIGSTEGFVMYKLIAALSDVQSAKANEIYHKRYADAQCLCRATTIDELEEMLKGPEAWQNWKGDFDYASLTLNRQTALGFIRYNKQNRPGKIGVIFKFLKEEITDYVVSPGYNLAPDAYDTKKLYDPMTGNIEFEEHRLKKNIPIDKVHMGAKIFANDDHDYYKNRYRKLDNVNIGFEALQ